MLTNLLQQAAEVTGVRDVTPESRKQLLRYINRAARELYDKYDLPGTVLEITACVDPAEGQITLPWYVDQIRAVRRNDLYQPIKLHDIRPRYHETPWRQRLLEWRVKKRTAIHTPLTVESQVTLTLDEPQTETVTFAIAGQTASAGMKEEVLILQPGAVTITSATQWAKETPFGIERITKNALTSCDVIVTQTSSGAEIAEIPNRAEKSQYILVQVNDFDAGSETQTYCVDVLFKRPFTELYYDHDVFGDGKLEDSLIWLLRAHFAASSKDPAVVQLAGGYANAAENLIRNVNSNQAKEVEHEMSFTTPPGEGAWRYGRFLRGRRFWR